MADTTIESISAEGLGRTQQTALAALKEGKSFPQAAEAAGVSRATVYRWVQSDPHFRAAYNLWQQEQAESARARVLGLAEKAVQVVEKALDRDNEKVAVGMLRHLGMIRRPPRGATDPEVVKLQMDLAREREKYRALMGMDTAPADQGWPVPLAAATIPAAAWKVRTCSLRRPGPGAEGGFGAGRPCAGEPGADGHGETGADPPAR